MKQFVFLLSRFMVSFLYKWMLPIVIIIITVGYADKNQNDIFRYLLGGGLCVFYLGIPMNFEKKASEHFSYLSKNILFVVVGITIQAILLSTGVFLMTGAFVLWYFPELVPYLHLISVLNSSMYFGTVIFLYFVEGLKINAFRNSSD